MKDDLDLVASLLSFELGQAIPIATHRKVAIHDDGLVICPVSLAGEEATIHAIAIGRVGSPPKVRTVPDPRYRDDQYALFEWLARGFESYYRQCRKTGKHPQIWVSSPPGIGLLDTLAERLRYNQGSDQVRRLGELLSYATDRAPISGQQALHSASEALLKHWTTGQHSADDQHLGSLLVWLEPPAGGRLKALEAIREAEKCPCGVKTKPEFDSKTLLPLVVSYNTARREQRPDHELKFMADQIEDALTPLVVGIFEKTQRAIKILQRAELPPLGQLNELERRENDAFMSFMSSRDAGYPLSLRDRPKAAAFKLAEREDAVSNYEASLLMDDQVSRARAVLQGKVLKGTVTNPRKVRIAPRRFDHLFEIVSEQEVLHLRENTELYLEGNAGYAAAVVSLTRENDQTIVGLKITKGQRKYGLPSVGMEHFWLPKAPNWHWIFSERKQFKERLQRTPWTHNESGERPQTAPRPAPADPLRAVEELRC